LPRPSCSGKNSYNGFTGKERARQDRVTQVLRRNGSMARPSECSLCGATSRTGLQAETHCDPFSVIPVCFACHMALPARLSSPSKWIERLERHASGHFTQEFRCLPLREVDFAPWLRATSPGPHDLVRAIRPSGL
jgi:hypothetical protein